MKLKVVVVLFVAIVGNAWSQVHPEETGAEALTRIKSQLKQGPVDSRSYDSQLENLQRQIEVSRSFTTASIGSGSASSIVGLPPLVSVVLAGKTMMDPKEAVMLGGASMTTGSALVALGYQIESDTKKAVELKQKTLAQIRANEKLLLNRLVSRNPEEGRALFADYKAGLRTEKDLIAFLHQDGRERVILMERLSAITADEKYYTRLFDKIKIETSEKEAELIFDLLSRFTEQEVSAALEVDFPSVTKMIREQRQLLGSMKSIPVIVNTAPLHP